MMSGNDQQIAWAHRLELQHVVEDRNNNDDHSLKPYYMLGGGLGDLFHVISFYKEGNRFHVADPEFEPRSVWLQTVNA